MSEEGPDSYVNFLEVTYKLCSKYIKQYSHKKSRKDYTLPQKLTIYLFAMKFNIKYREALTLIGDNSTYRDILDLDFIPSASSLTRAKEATSPITLHYLVKETGKRIEENKHDKANKNQTFILDATYYNDHYTSPYYHYNHGGDGDRGKRGFKAHVCFDQTNNAIFRVFGTKASVHEVKPTPALVQGLKNKQGKLIADKAYSSIRLRKLYTQLDLMHFVPRKEYGKQEKLHNQVLKAHGYNKRLTIESLFYSIKRRFGATLTQKNKSKEVIAKFLCHNLEELVKTLIIYYYFVYERNAPCLTVGGKV